MGKLGPAWALWLYALGATGRLDAWTRRRGVQGSAGSGLAPLHASLTIEKGYLTLGPKTKVVSESLSHWEHVGVLRCSGS